MRPTPMSAILFIAQRASAAVLAFAVTVHLATILYAVRGGLTAGEILARTRDNHWFFAFYVLFVLAVAVHAPIGLRNVLREWTRWHGRSLDVVLALFSMLLLVLGIRAALAVYVSPERLFGGCGPRTLSRASSPRSCIGSPGSRLRSSCRCTSGPYPVRSAAPTSSTSS